MSNKTFRTKLLEMVETINNHEVSSSEFREAVLNLDAKYVLLHPSDNIIVRIDVLSNGTIMRDYPSMHKLDPNTIVLSIFDSMAKTQLVHLPLSEVTKHSEYKEVVLTTMDPITKSLVTDTFSENDRLSVCKRLLTGELISLDVGEVEIGDVIYPSENFSTTTIGSMVMAKTTKTKVLTG